VLDLARSVEGESSRGMFHAQVSDAGAVEHLVAELMPLGATELVMPKLALAAKHLDEANPIAARRVTLVNADFQAETRTSAVLAPVLEDLKIEQDRPPFGDMQITLHVPDVIAEELLHATFDLWDDIRVLMLGIEHGLQVQMDLAQLAWRLDFVGAHVRSPRARSVIAELRAVLNCYRRTEVAALRLIPSSEAEVARRFEEFVRLAEYEQLSHEVYGLGVPGMVRLAKKRISNLVHDLLRSPRVAKLLALGSRVAAVAEKTPDVSDLLGETILDPNYLPPIVDLTASIQRARKAWLGERPENEWVERSPYD